MKTIITTIVLTFIALCGFGQSTSYAKLDSFFSVLEENNQFFGSVAVAQGGVIIYTKAIGYADVANNISNNIETKFRIGSISKTFTATLIMKAVEMGYFNLDDTIESFFPAIQNANKITIRYLLNHRSGINTITDKEYFSWYTEAITRDALLEKIISKGIDFEPNAEYVYSNSNYILLSFILEKTFDSTFGKILDEYIVHPLALANTSYGGPINPLQNEALSYQMDTQWTLEPEGDMSIPLGAGGIISTPSDLCQFAKALFDGNLISAKSVEQMKPVGDDSYGFALYATPLLDMAGWGHGGAIDAFTSSFSYFEENDLSFAISCNGSNYSKHDISTAVLSEIFNKPYKLPSFEYVALSSEDLDQYLGVYECEELPMDLTISKGGNTLIAQGEGQGAFTLLAEGDHRFSKSQIGLKMHFIPNQQKLQFEQGGMKFEMTLKSEIKTKEVASVEVKNENLDQYVGVYASAQLPIDLTISKEGNDLFGQGTGQAPFPLKAEGDHVFSNEKIGLRITFMPKEKKMNFVQGGASFEMATDQ